MMQEARAQTESFMARVAREPDAVQAVTDHITSLNFGLAHQHDKVKRLERQVRTIETLKLRLADAISGETLCSNFILDSIGEDFNAARTLRRHTAEWRTKILDRYGKDVQQSACDYKAADPLSTKELLKPPRVGIWRLCVQLALTARKKSAAQLDA
jgi:hypothetical protein